ncbi:hypothetical protein [Oceanobacillus jeddahense]|uniref:Uncharacterized protein n=1 Tax=Oceanobacillus jeddahense TaxID=1462527 RepID=A0ABY5JPL0_9BACI|nr:hypothetical protein [Oceanobacillus jeddahense]UUI01103.1 hypothetical protein NP439_13630 [Oceanobacillus jeddahense]
MNVKELNCIYYWWKAGEEKLFFTYADAEDEQGIQKKLNKRFGLYR